MRKRMTCTGYNGRKILVRKLWIITSDREDRGRIENIKFYSIKKGPLAHVEPECSVLKYIYLSYRHIDLDVKVRF